MDELVKLGLKIPNFYRTNGNYEKLQKLIDNDTIRPNSYVYDTLGKKLIYVKDDKTYDCISGDGGAQFTVLTGTSESPIRIATLTDGIYVLQGNYVIQNTDVDYMAKAPVMVFVEVEENPSVVYATIYTNNGCTMYKIEENQTTINRLVTEETVVNIVNETVNDQVQQIVEDIAPDIIDDNIEPVPDQDVDDYMDDLLNRLFPEVPQGGGD